MKSSLFESQRALSVLAFLCEIRVLGWFVYLCSLCMGFLRSILKVLSYRTQWDAWWHLWLEFRPKPFSVFGDHVSPHVHHKRTTFIE